MVRSELLRAKSLHAEVAYLRDLKRVGDAKRTEEQKNLQLREKERKFWAEATRNKNPLSVPGQQDNSHVSAPSTMQAAAQLDRMRRAHSQLQEAHKTHADAANNLKKDLATLSTSQKRVEVLEKLLAKAQRVRANQVESRLSEEVADLVTTSQTVMKLRGLRSAEAEALGQVALGDVSPADGLPSDRGSMKPDLAVVAGAPLAISSLTPSLQQGGVSLPSPQPSQAPLLVASSPLSPPIGIARAPSPAQIGITNISCTTTQSQPSLSLSCSLGNRGTVGLQITKAESGGLKVLIDPSVGTLASGVLREKGAIQSRLQAMGIKVSTIDIGVAGDSPGMMKRAKRSVMNEDEDEGNIS